MENDIIKLIGLKDEDINIIKIEVLQSYKYIHIEKKLKSEFCPHCNSRMHSKGIYKRQVNHPVLQDGFQLVLIIHQRKWQCTNDTCKLIHNDEFTFIEKYKQSTNLTPYMILYELKDLSVTASQVSKKFFVSDTYVHYTFMQYVDLPRLPLPKYLSVDEVYLDFDSSNRYALILMDFLTGEIIDILPNRNDHTTSSYFYSITKEERDNVEFLICDMYNPYINYTKKYFSHSRAIIDSFHVIQWLNQKINQYINQVKKKFQERDSKALEERNRQTNKEEKTIVVSKEVYLLNNFKWLLLMNQQNINYSEYRRYNKKLRMYLDTYDLEKAFLSLDENFMEIRRLKEKYILFNQSKNLLSSELENELNLLIDEYSKSSLTIFKQFSILIKKYKAEIIHSFTYIPSSSNSNDRVEFIRRLSNGPMEGFNRKPKDYKRSSRGVCNFQYTRNRILWATRDNAAIRAIPKSWEDIHTYTSKTRKPYKK